MFRRNYSLTSSDRGVNDLKDANHVNSSESRAEQSQPNLQSIVKYFDKKEKNLTYKTSGTKLLANHENSKGKVFMDPKHHHLHADYVLCKKNRPREWFGKLWNIIRCKRPKVSSQVCARMMCVKKYCETLINNLTKRNHYPLLGN